MRRLLGVVVNAAIAVGAKRMAAAVLTVSAAGIAGITLHEDKVNKVYLDIARVPTVCVGNTSSVTAADVGKVFSDAVCERLLVQDLAPVERSLKRSVRVPITQNQYDALADFVFNKGVSAFESSTLLRKLNAGDCHGAAAEFPKWNKARVKGVLRPVQGLTNRALDQRNLFEPDCQ